MGFKSATYNEIQIFFAHDILKEKELEREK